jgi:hypothetical protein
MAQTTAHDVISALTDTHEKLATRLDNAPTGVVPGYNSALGGTVLPNGKLRYVKATAASAFTLLAEARIVTSMTTATDGKIINFDDVNYDPSTLITTGASWSIALAAGWYMAVAGISINSNTNIIAAHEYWDLALYDITHSAQLDTVDRLQHPTQINGGVGTSDFFLSGSVVFNVASAITARCRFQTNQFTFGVDRTIGGGRFALMRFG